MSHKLARLVLNLVLALAKDYATRHLPPTGQSEIETLIRYTERAGKEEGLL